MNMVKPEYNLKYIIFGIVFCIIGTALPAVLVPETFGVEYFLETYISQGDRFYLLLSACGIVFLNCIRALPFFLGTFLIVENCTFFEKKDKTFICNCVLTFVLLPLLYVITNVIHHLHLYFGYTSYLIIIFVLILLYMDLFSVSLTDKIMLLAFSQLSLQWFDEIPALTKWGFGHGTVTLEIKEAAVLLHDDRLLTTFALIMSGIFTLFLVLQTRLLYQKHHLKISAIEKQKADEAMYSAQIEALKLRTNSELSHLVHDLKSPLTTIQGLTGLCLMMERDENLKEYMQKINDSSDIMSSMISDILYEDKKEYVTTKELMDKVLSQIYTYIPTEKVHVENAVPDDYISINMVRFARALVNIIDNAYRFMDSKDGLIHIKISEKDEEIIFEITDNGKGISEKDLDNIWNYGYSGRNSTGLGLSYVRQTVENHSGVLHIESKENEYTTVTIKIGKEVV